MYPLKFNHIYFKTVWGGRSMESFRDDLPEGSLGESWDISCHSHGTNKVINGKFKGMSLEYLIDKYPKEILGENFHTPYFPLHISLLDANDNLSVQVHPNDEFALKTEGEPGKTEAWYILDCEDNATLIAGLKQCSSNEFQEAVKNNNVLPLLNKIKVKKGDLILIPSGMVHGLGKGILALEISQNSDTTYRVFDYNRGRELHINKAIQVIDTELNGINCIGQIEKNNGYTINHRLKSKNFNIDTIEINRSYGDISNSNMFFTFTCVSGSGYLKSNDDFIPIHYGDSILLPASTGEFEFVGTMMLVKSYVPEL